jgi:hypothetical protein
VAAGALAGIMSGMRAPGLALATAFAAIAGRGAVADAGPRRGGKVVRVPRPPVVLSTAVRICSLYEESIATCDRAVQLGEVGAVIDDERNRGLATVRLVEAQTDGCGTPVQWRISLAMQAPDADAPSHGLLVLDYEVQDRARTLGALGPPPREGEQVLQVIDRDGDLRVSQYGCDARGGLDRTTRPAHRCTDYWLSLRGRWRRARADRAAVCDR